MDLTSHREKVFFIPEDKQAKLSVFHTETVPMDTPGFPMATRLPGAARRWEKMSSLSAFTFLYICIISILFQLLGWVSKWLQHKQKVQDADSRDVVMVTERETGWLETWRQVIKDAQKPGTRVWYCPATLRQNSNEDETFCPMLVINAYDCSLRHRDSESLRSTEERYCL